MRLSPLSTTCIGLGHPFHVESGIFNAVKTWLRTQYDAPPVETKVKVDSHPSSSSTGTLFTNDI